MKSQLGEAVGIFKHLPRLWTKVHSPAPAATNPSATRPARFLPASPSLYPKPHGLGHDHPTPGTLLLLPPLPAPYHSWLRTNVPSPGKPFPCPCLVLLHHPVSSLGSPARTMSIYVCPCLPVADLALLNCEPREDRELFGLSAVATPFPAQPREGPVELLCACVCQTEPSSPRREMGLLLERVITPPV